MKERNTNKTNNKLTYLHIYLFFRSLLPIPFTFRMAKTYLVGSASIPIPSKRLKLNSLRLYTLVIIIIKLIQLIVPVITITHHHVIFCIFAPAQLLFAVSISSLCLLAIPFFTFYSAVQEEN